MAELTLSTLKDAETGQRGFMITGRSSYLDQYNSAERTVELALDDLERLAGDNGLQLALATDLRQLVSNKLSEMATTRLRP